LVVLPFGFDIGKLRLFWGIESSEMYLTAINHYARPISSVSFSNPETS